MNHGNYSDEYIQQILKDVRTVAMVGASANTVRPSYFVLKYLLDKGYTVIPINPGQAGKQILNQTVFASLSEIGPPVDMVDIFRASEAIPGVLDEILSLPVLPKVVWMQLGVENHEAAAKAEANGIKVVMNRCPKIEYGRLSGEIGWSGVNSGRLSSKKPVLRQGFQHWGLRR